MKQQIIQLEIGKAALEARVGVNHDDVTSLKTEQATLKEQSKTTFRLLSKIEDSQLKMTDRISIIHDTIQTILIKLN
jgi:hypothetical protein